MKLIEYIQSQSLLINYDVIRLNNYYKYISSIQDKNVVFIELSEDLIENNNICELFEQYQNKLIILSNPDIDFPPPKKPYTYDKYSNKYSLPNNYQNLNYYDKIETRLIDIIEKNNLYIIAHSISIYNPRISFVPLGIYSEFNHFYLKKNNKTILCYANFGLSIDRWYGNPRNIINNLIKDKYFIYKENINNSRNSISQSEYYNKISQSKFAICPRGCGIDTYRLWDCICLGCIPIVEKYDGHTLLNDLPILFLNNINDYATLTEEFLNNTYDIFLTKDFNYNILLLSNIVNQIKVYKDKLNI
jgi:hypothetical protein